jgi:hypothetical protein
MGIDRSASDIDRSILAFGEDSFFPLPYTLLSGKGGSL